MTVPASRKRRPPRRLCIFCDGTEEDADSEVDPLLNTNVSLLFHLLSQEGTTADGAPIEQFKTYQAGVGTANGGAVSDILATLTAGLGSGMLDKAEKLYMDFLVPNWQMGDEIFLFGFSRGAATARILLNLINMIGIMDTPEWLDTFPTLFKLLRKEKGPQTIWSTHKPLADALKANAVHKARQDRCLEGEFLVKAIAVFDTVSTRGRPTELRRHAATQDAFEYDALGVPAAALPECVEMAFQALALNETRNDYKPDVWKRDEGAVWLGQRLEQMWFAGIHTDIGGGQRNHELSVISLTWMIAQLQPYLAFDMDRVAKLVPAHATAPWGELPPHKLVSYNEKLSQSNRTLPAALDSDTNERIHPSVLQQPNLRSDIALVVHSHPKLIGSLLPLEESLKQHWTFVGTAEDSGDEDGSHRASATKRDGGALGLSTIVPVARKKNHQPVQVVVNAH